MLIILEGNECNFKTTVAEKLSKELNLPVVKGSSFELAQCSNQELYEHFLRLSQMDNVIVDRSWISNYVYATLYKDYAILSPEQRLDIEQQVYDKALLVYLYADEETIIGRLRVRGDEYVEESKIGTINKVYLEAMDQTELIVHSFNTKKNSSDDIVKKIYKQIN
ncbi:MAG: hypothetical protein ACI35O_03825 [Bacillaceae bacterium]